MDVLQKRLFALRDEQYVEFQRKLIPTVPPETVMGVRIPVIRSFAKTFSKEPGCARFLDALPHAYYDENLLHAVLVSGIREFDECVRRLELFLPHMDNWAVCDTLLPVSFPKNADRILPLAYEWMKSSRVYTCRFGISMLMRYFLNDRFSPDQPAAVAAVVPFDYYVDMMIAWYFATALAKQWDAVLPYFTHHLLGYETERKAVRKAIESYRISDDRKKILRDLFEERKKPE